ncbi:MAG: hypothetical protein ACYTG5_09350 [Planctomycetota bacterium]|jgi:hypothetical protein
MSDAAKTGKEDLLGRELSEEEREVLELYQRLRTLAARKDVAPCVSMNAKQAMVMLWNACTDLGLIHEEAEVD